MNNESGVMVDRAWAQAVSEAIRTRNAVQLTNAIEAAEQGAAATLREGDGPAITALVNALYEALNTAADQSSTHQVQKKKMTVTPAIDMDEKEHRAAHHTRHSRHNNTRTQEGDHGTTPTEAQLANAKEYTLCATTAVRVAVAGTLAAYQLQHRTTLIVQSTSAYDEDITDNGDAEADLSEGARLQWAYHNTLLKGMLFAFVAFQEMHSMERRHYPPRTGSSTIGTVGWDTLLLLHFVHKIPQVALKASGRVVDEVSGEVVRSWRRLLLSVQSADAQEAPEHSRRRGALAIVNGLLMIFFARNNTHQCAVLLQTVDHAEKVTQQQQNEMSDSPARSILQPSAHMVSEMVTYYYYKGRMHLYDGHLAAAHEALREAYRLLPATRTGTALQERNKQRVRFFLAVAGIAAGRALPAELVAVDQLLQLIFGPIILAISRGDPMAFQTALESYGSTLRRRGVYLILQHTKHLCYLMLLARVHAAMSAMPGVDPSRVTLDVLLAAYRYVLQEGGEAARQISPSRKLSSDTGSQSTSPPRAARKRERRPAENEADALEMITDDRLVLWLAKLIACGDVRGYISHEHRTLVLSKTDPFPLLRSTMLQ